MGVFIVIWLVCGFVAAMIASSKGTSAGGAFVFGVLFGPLGILIAAVQSPNADQIERRQAEQGMVKCRFCAERIRPEATVCRHCGKDVPEDMILEHAARLAAPQPGGNAANACKDSRHDECRRNWCTCSCHSAA